MYIAISLTFAPFWLCLIKHIKHSKVVVRHFTILHVSVLDQIVLICCPLWSSFFLFFDLWQPLALCTILKYSESGPLLPAMWQPLALCRFLNLGESGLLLSISLPRLFAENSTVLDLRLKWRHLSAVAGVCPAGFPFHFNRCRCGEEHLVGSCPSGFPPMLPLQILYQYPVYWLQVMQSVLRWLWECCFYTCVYRAQHFGKVGLPTVIKHGIFFQLLRHSVGDRHNTVSDWYLKLLKVD